MRLTDINYATLTQQHHRSYLSPTHVDSSQVLNSIPFSYSKLHHFNNTINSPNTSSNSNNNNDNNVGEANALLEDRNQKRVFSNRESAHRSRTWKKQQIESLQCNQDNLQTLNRQLSEKIIYMLECNQQILEHNAQLKDKVSSLQVALSELLGPLEHVDQHHHHFHTGLVPEPSSATVFHQLLAGA